MTSTRQTGGYVRAYRRRWEHPLFRNKQEAAVWAWLTDCAAFTDHCMATKYGPIDLKRGQILVSERNIARDFNLHKNAVRALLSRLDQEHMITRFWDHSRRKAGTIVTVVNYEKFQGPTPHEQGGQDQSAARDGTAAGPQRDRSGTKNKEGKEGKERKKEKYAFAGAVVRLNEQDFQRWQETYSNIPNLRAALESRDAWLRQQPAKVQHQWFHSTAALLAKKDAEYARGGEPDPDAAYWHDVEQGVIH